MEKLTIYIHRDGMFSLLNLIHLPSSYSTQNALKTLTLEELLLVEWRGRFTPHNLLTWQMRNNQKAYGLKLTLPLAVALHRTLRSLTLSEDLLEVLRALDKALVNVGFSTKNLTLSIA